MTVDFLRSRHSVRSFTPEPLSQEAVRGLKAEITMVNTHEAGMHFEIGRASCRDRVYVLV